jgi:hypothetical protein
MALSYPRTLFAYFLLFGALYAGFGVQSPYLPRLLQEHGLRAEGLVTGTIDVREEASSNRVSCRGDGILPLRRRFGSEDPQRGP